MSFIAYQKRRVAQTEYLLKLLGGKCVNCGSTEQLEFDHINPENVEFRIGRKTGKYRLDRLVKEALKCQLLCNPCHWSKTRRDRGLKDPAHGTVNMYRNYKCRCQDCRDAWAASRLEYQRNLRNRKKLANALY